MKVLNAGDIIHSSMFWHPISEKLNQYHGHGLLIPSVVQKHRLLRFNVWNRIRYYYQWSQDSIVDRLGGDHLPVHLHTILMSLTAFRKGDYQAYWRNIKSNETEHSESTANAVYKVFGDNWSIDHLSCVPSKHSTTYGLAYASHIHRLWPLSPHVRKPLEYALLITALNATRGLVLHYTRF